MPKYPQASPSTYFAAGVASVALLKLITAALQARSPDNNYPQTTSSPLQKYQYSSQNDLAYPPSGLIPGQRDVPSPYGTIRVYEFGPTDATRKILFLHGISTPCISLLGIAENLAYKRGCRVMLMDLFGRGWSDGPVDLPYDGRLYASQIFIALTSSPLAWTGEASGGFELVGYSLGGAIAADFTSWFPELVSQLVLIAPGGIIRKENLGWGSRILYSQGWLPESWLHAGVKRRLRVKPNVSATQKASEFRGPMYVNRKEETKGRDAEAAPSAELPENAVIRTARGEINIEAAVNWQMENHPGFLPAFMSSIRHTPVYGQQDRWRMIGARIDEQHSVHPDRCSAEQTGVEEREATRGALGSGKILIILGGKDAIIKVDEIVPDVNAILGKQHLDIRTYQNAGHEMPISCFDEVANDIFENGHM